MATKTITTTVALHAPGRKHKPFKYDAGSRVEGFYDAEVTEPGKPVTLDADEADAILKRFGGKEITADGEKVVEPAATLPPKVTTDPGKPLAPKP